MGSNVIPRTDLKGKSETNTLGVFYSQTTITRISQGISYFWQTGMAGVFLMFEGTQ